MDMQHGATESTRAYYCAYVLRDSRYINAQWLQARESYRDLKSLTVEGELELLIRADDKDSADGQRQV